MAPDVEMNDVVAELDQEVKDLKRISRAIDSISAGSPEAGKIDDRAGDLAVAEKLPNRHHVGLHPAVRGRVRS